ncbi:hypothetical protein T484DRAFT_1867962 [Baffinella frigidus]|nr:hypothetical protein T484DRAFT_1867962 [Cryptophyta sp. CCMP2293]
MREDGKEDSPYTSTFASILFKPIYQLLLLSPLLKFIFKMHADDGNCCVKCLKWSANCVAFFIYLITVGLCGFFLYTMIVQTDTKAAANDAVESHEVGGFTMPWYASVAIVLFAY